MEGAPPLIPWIVPIRDESKLLGTGVVVAKKFVITCKHVLGAALDRDLIVGGNGSQTPRAVRVWRATDADLALLETDIAWPEQATLMIDPGVPECLPADANISALGYDFSSAGQHLSATRFTALDLSRREQRRSVYGTDNTSLFRAEGLIEEGSSGGPLVLSDGSSPIVIGINALGGRQAPMASFISIGAVAKFLYSHGITPRFVAARANGAGTPRRNAASHRAESWRQMLGLPATSVVLTLRLADQILAERFVLLPPQRTTSAQLGQPLLVQESVVSDALLKRFGSTEHAARGLSPSQLESLLEKLTDETQVALRLLRPAEWLNAITADGDEALPLCRPRNPVEAASSSRLTPKNSAGFRPPPHGCYEITLDDAMAATRPIVAYAAEASRNGAPISVHLSRADLAPGAVFRLAIPAMARLQTLAPQWG